MKRYAYPQTFALGAAFLPGLMIGNVQLPGRWLQPKPSSFAYHQKRMRDGTLKLTQVPVYRGTDARGAREERVRLRKRERNDNLLLRALQLLARQLKEKDDG